jgi:integrase
MRDAAHEGRHGDRDEAIVATFYDTGLRRGELSQVDRGMLDLDRSELRVPARIQKDYPNDEEPPPRTIELDRAGQLRTVRALRSWLNDHPDGEPLFVGQKGDRMSGKGLNDVVKRCADRADVEPYTYEGRAEPADVSSHTLRHSVAWRMLRDEDGNELYDVRNRLRHSSILTTERRYDHFATV